MTSSAIVGVGMTPFGKHVDTSLKALGAAAVHDALADAGVTREQVDMAFVANAMASIVTGQVSVVGQTILREDGFAGTPVYNVDNACAGSSTALNLAAMAIAAGSADTVLVLGVEKLFSDRRERAYLALNGAADQDLVAASGIDPANESVFVTAVYPQRLKAYADRYGLERETLARIAVKNRRHAALNPLAQYTKPVTVEDVLGSWMVADPVTALMCAPIGDGAAAVVLTRAELAREDGRRPVWLRGSAIGMGGPGAASAIQRTATLAYEQAEIEPRDVDGGVRLDDLVGDRFLVLARTGAALGDSRGWWESAAGALVATPATLPGAWPELERWLDRHAADVVVVRPDRRGRVAGRDHDTGARPARSLGQGAPVMSTSCSLVRAVSRRSGL